MGQELDGLQKKLELMEGGIKEVSHAHLVVANSEVMVPYHV